MEVTWALPPTTPASAPVSRTTPVTTASQTPVVELAAAQAVERVVVHRAVVAIRTIKKTQQLSRNSIIFGTNFDAFIVLYLIAYHMVRVAEEFHY